LGDAASGATPAVTGHLDDPWLPGHQDPLPLGDRTPLAADNTDCGVPTDAVVATIPVGEGASDIVISPDSQHVYVARRDSVAVIGRSQHVVATIPVTGDARDLAINADGTRLFVTDYGGSVSVIKTHDRTVRTVSGDGNSAVAVSSDGCHIYAARHAISDGERYSVISMIEVDGTTVAAMSVVNDVTALAISPDGARLYAVSSDRGSYYQYPAGSLSIIDTTTKAVIATISVGANPDGVSASPDGGHLYITHQDMSSVSAVDLRTNGVTAIALVDAPLGVTFTPDGAQAYVSGPRSLTVIDTGSHHAHGIVTGDLPRRVQISPDGKRAYITNFGDHTVSIVDTATQSVTNTVAVRGHPEALAVSPNGEMLCVADYWFGAVTMIAVPSVRDLRPDAAAMRAAS
jgi:YVTN family beta-propeller protein